MLAKSLVAISMSLKLNTGNCGTFPCSPSNAISSASEKTAESPLTVELMSCIALLFFLSDVVIPVIMGYKYDLILLRY